MADDVRAAPPTRIVDGIEWFRAGCGDDEDCQCARCGSSAFGVDCWNCGGTGYSDHECGEDTCCCADPYDNVPCDICQGEGGWMRCCSGRDWCEAHPMPGREHIQSTAVNRDETD